MCGIAGILTREPDTDLDAVLGSMLVELRHRGPDDEGSVQVALPGGYRLGLCQTRLAILDLSPLGHQPMTEPASGSWFVFNGEVYNFRDVRRQLGGTVRSTGDAETVLRAWVEQGEASLASLRGMFAFALYDGRRQQLWLVRDRLGVKPLYVAQTGPGTWLFASEVRALLASGLLERRLDRRAVASYLTFGAVTAPATMLAGVESILPAEGWRFDLSCGEVRPERRRYWRPDFAPEAGMTREEALERIRPVLLESVALRMVSDVPVGVFLSGGIDSSSVVAALAMQGHKLRTFSVVFGEPQFDESAHSREIAARFGTEHTELLLRPAEVLADLEQALAAYDQPSIDGVNTYFISRATRHAGVKVALSGIGGDELFAGYPYFRLLHRFDAVGSRALARIALGFLSLLTPHSTRTTKLGGLLSANGSRLARYAVCRQVLSSDHSRALFSGTASPLDAVPGELRQELEREVHGLDAVNAHSRLELALYLANMLLRDLDQMSMAHALELREPLLDHVLVETVARVPGRLKLAGGPHRTNKALLVDALPGGLPDSILRRKKMGFVFPWERWLRHELKDWAAGILSDADTLQAIGLNGAAVKRLWGDFLACRPGVRYTDVLCLLHMLHWVRQHRLTIREPLPACAP